MSQLHRFGVIGLKPLSERLSDSLSYNALLKRVLKLEKHKLCKSFVALDGKKYIYLSDEGMRFFPDYYTINEDTLEHEAFASNVLCKFLDHTFFYDFEMSHELNEERRIPDKDITDPDFVLFSRNKSITTSIAVEAERVQKNRTRIFDKFEFYSNSNFYDLFFYVFYSDATFRSYQKRYFEFMENDFFRNSRSNFETKCCLILAPEVYEKDFNILESKIFRKGKEKLLKDFISYAH